MTDKKLELREQILDILRNGKKAGYAPHRPSQLEQTRIKQADLILDLLKQERNKVLDQLEADVKDTVTIFSETVPADPEWLPLSLLLKAIKKLRVDNTTDV